MRKLFLVLALVGFGAGSAGACEYMKTVATPKPIVTADGKTVTPAQTPLPKTGG